MVDDIYMYSKIECEKYVLSQNNVSNILTCAIRPSGIWGEGDGLLFTSLFTTHLLGMLNGVLTDARRERSDNTYVENLIHGEVLAASDLCKGAQSKAAGTQNTIENYLFILKILFWFAGEAFFINDCEIVLLADLRLAALKRS